MSSEKPIPAMKFEGMSALVPKLRFPEFREAEGWTKRWLGDFLRESRLPGNKGNVARKITVKLWGKGVFEKNEAIQGSANTQYYRRKAGQFIYSKLDFLNQAFGIIPDSLDQFESTVDLPCFDITPGLNAVFLLEYVKRKEFYVTLGESADGSRKARRIHPDVFLSFPIALPPLPEQQKIADCLSSLDVLIAAQAQKVEALKTHKQGLLQQLFPREGETQPRLRFPEFQDAGEWEETELGQCLEKVIDYRGKPPPKAESGVPLITAKNVRFGWLDWSNDEYIDAYAYDSWMTKGIPTLGDILFTTKAPLGNVAMFPAEGTYALGKRIITLRCKTKECIPEFLFQSLLGPEMQERIDFHSTGSTAKGIKSSVFVTLAFRHPKVSEQQLIAEFLSSLDAQITADTQKLEAFMTHKKGLMQQLFPATGVDEP
jgi:type I restriction enzyme S subunit